MFLLLIISFCFAQEEPEPTVVYKSKTEIDFEGLEIEGEMLKPLGTVIQDRSRASFNPLIQLRTDFNQEMSLSVDSVK